MLTRTPHNLGTVPLDGAPQDGDTFEYAGRLYTVDHVRPIVWREKGDPVPRARVYGYPVREPASRSTLALAAGLAAWVLVFIGVMLAPAPLLPDAQAITTAQYVAKPGKATSKLMAWHAHGQPTRCDFDHNGRYGRAQAECVVRVVFRHDGAAIIRDAFRTITGESGWKHTAVGYNRNGTKDCGPWQINSVHGQSCKRMMDWVASTVFAHRLWVRVGRHFSPTWVAATKAGVR